jgi:hypothetical protein
VFEPNLRAPAGFVTTDWRRGDRDNVVAGEGQNSCLDLARDNP